MKIVSPLLQGYGDKRVHVQLEPFVEDYLNELANGADDLVVVLLVLLSSVALFVLLAVPKIIYDKLF